MAVVPLLMGLVARGDEVTERYFDELRQRRLFSVAEGYCLDRLSDAALEPRRRAELSLELSRTLVEHAWYATGREQDELWQRAQQVLTDGLAAARTEPERTLLAIQAALVPAARGQALRWQVELFPHDAAVRRQALAAFDEAIPRLRNLERELTERHAAAQAAGNRERRTQTAWDVRKLLMNVQYQLAAVLVDQANVFAAGSADRADALLEAERYIRPLTGGAPGEAMTWNSRLLLAEVHRLRGNLRDAGVVLGSLERDEPPPAVTDRVLAERVRLLLHEDNPTEAALRLSTYRKIHPYPPGELCYLDVQALLALRRVAVEKKDDGLADELLKRGEASVERTERDIGGYWAWRCRVLLDQGRQASRYGDALAAMVRQARAAYVNGDTAAALAQYEAARQAAETAGQADLALELGDTRGSILLQAGRFQEAADEFRRAAQTAPQHPRAAAAHLLFAYALGRLYEQQPKEERRVAYTDALLHHRQSYADDPTAHDAAYMLGLLAERHRQWEVEAVPLYRTIPSDHRRSPEAQLGIARCHERTLAWQREQLAQLPESERPARREWISTLEDRFIDELAALVAKFPPEPQPLPPRQAELALRLARLRLHRQPPEYAEADRLLVRITAPPPEGAEPAEPLRREAAQLRIVALAGQRRFDAARELLHALAASGTAEVLGILDGLNDVAREADELTRQRLGELQLQTAQELDRRRGQLDADQQRRLDHCLAQANLATGRAQQAVAIYRKLLAAAPRDAALLRTTAQVLEDNRTPESRQEAKDLWRKAEAAAPPGSPDWLSARLHVARCTFALGQHDECRKLLAVTRLLYPDLGGDPLRSQFTDLQRQLDAAHARRQGR